MSKSVIIINLCDQWKSYDSFDLFGVFTNRKKIVSELRKLEKQGDIVNDSGHEIKEMSYKEMHDMLTYVSVESVTLNEIQ